MTRNFSRLFVAALAFNVDVTIHAASPVKWDLMQSPTNCIEEVSECAIYTEEHQRKVIPFGKHKLALGQETIVQRRSNTLLRLVKGRVLLESVEQAVVETEFGKVIVQSGKAIVSRTQNRISVKAISGKIHISPRYEKGSEIFLPSGFETWFAGLSRSGSPMVEVPQAISFAKLIEEWGALYPGGRDEFRKELLSFKPNWESAVVQAGPWHKGLVERHLASVEQQRLAREKRRKAIREENARLRRLFRQKTYHD